MLTLDTKNCVYAVIEQDGVLKIKEVVISKESAKAVFLGDSLLMPASGHPKRLLIKGYDRIARSKKEAMEHYIEFAHWRLIELEATRRKIEELLEQARKFQV